MRRRRYPPPRRAGLIRLRIDNRPRARPRGRAMHILAPARDTSCWCTSAASRAFWVPAWRGLGAT